MQSKLCRSSHDKKVCGVCGGLALYFGIDSTIIRLIWVFLAFCCGFGLIPYLIMAVIMPIDEYR